MSGDRLSLQVAGDLQEIPRVAEAVEAFCEGAGASPRAVMHLNLAIEELLTNTISYGGALEITLDMRLEGETIVAEIADDGAAFDPLTEAPAPDLEASLQDRRIGGLGVHLVKTLMDEASYRRDDGKNRMRLVKRL
ncbi:MAG: ATP-binding protein [Caulobacteraceae bacterium]